MLYNHATSSLLAEMLLGAGRPRDQDTGRHWATGESAAGASRWHEKLSPILDNVWNAIGKVNLGQNDVLILSENDIPDNSVLIFKITYYKVGLVAL